MKKLFFTLIFLFFVYLGIQFAFTFFGKGENYVYELIKNDISFNIEENSTFRVAKNLDNYFYKIKVGNTQYSFQINTNFNKLTEVIKDIEYFKNEQYECILPIFKGNKILTDIICYKNGIQTYYHNLKGENNDLDHFAAGISVYDINIFKDNAKEEEIEDIKIYRENLIKKHYIGFTNYRGIYNVSEDFNSIVYKMDIYRNDIYNQKLGIFVGKYYLSADYDEQHGFNRFNLIDLVKLDTDSIISNVKISLDSYIQGIVDGKVYLFDKDNKKQYEINIDKKQVVEIGSTTLKYYNKEWTTMTLQEANNELKFITNNNDLVDSKYARIDKIGNKIGYYYLYEKVNNEYKVYRMNIQDKGMMYLFTTSSIENISYVGDYIYFVNGNNINYYNHLTGVRRAVSYSELEFNKSINLSVYAK